MKPELTYNGHTVTISATNVPMDSYDDVLVLMDHTLNHFRSTVTNHWGCDGVGYYIEKKQGAAFRHLSRVGPRNYKKGLEEIVRCNRCRP